MKSTRAKPGFAPALVLAAVFAAACGDSTGPGDSVNPALVEAAAESGFGARSTTLPQGYGPFSGPGGMAMDATGKEFIQQLTFKNGTVWRTSGIVVTAVPDEAVSGADFHNIAFGAAYPGSLASVQPGTYQMVSDFPEINFIDPMKLAYAQMREHNPRVSALADEGVITIQSVDYFPDVYTCDLYDGPTIQAESCTYQIGVIRGVVAFSGFMYDGAVHVVQNSTEFTLPIQRQTVIMTER